MWGIDLSALTEDVLAVGLVLLGIALLTFNFLWVYALIRGSK